MAILMVVFGHTPVLDATDCTRFVYAFHVPVFFILSGVLQRPLLNETGFLGFAKAKARRLLLPYCAYAVAGLATWYLFRAHWTSLDLRVSPWTAALSYVQGQPNFNPPLWFFLSLFICELIAFPFFRVRLNSREVGLSAALVAGLCFAIFKGYGAVWSIHGACLGVPFLVFGHKFRTQLDRISRNRWLMVALSLPILAIAVWLSLINDRVGMRAGVCGNPLLFYASALAGFLWLLTISPAARISRPISALGRASATIFAVHYMIGIFLMHAAKVASQSLHIQEGLPRYCFWVVFWLFWVGFVWAGIWCMQWLWKRIIKNVDS